MVSSSGDTTDPVVLTPVDLEPLMDPVGSGDLRLDFYRFKSGTEEHIYLDSVRDTTPVEDESQILSHSDVCFPGTPDVGLP